jgi:5-methyltetrahydropteroyltriglutamate--homocysteine methyltransferase
MLTTVVGNYPKIPSARDGVNLRKAINDEEKGKIGREQLEEVYKKTVFRTIDDQLETGVDIITDGQIRWLDLTWPLATSLDSVQPGGLRRFYDNNIYYRRPQVLGLMSRKDEIVADEYRLAAAYSRKPVKAVLCGPITFCDLSDNHYYKSFGKLAESISDILAEEVVALVEAGCKYIQLDEPSLPAYPERVDLAAKLYSKIFAGIDVYYGIFLYFNSIKEIADKLSDLPVKFIGLDLVSHPNDINLLDGFNREHQLVAGLFDGRNIMLENEKSIRTAIDRLAGNLPRDKIVLSPSCGLEFLPQRYAVAKLNRMCRVAAKL